jgi:cyclic pyranopterin phosphate synthase
MFDCFERRISYLRISVTSRCNLRCTYCRPDTRSCAEAPGELLSFDEVRAVVEAAARLGIEKVRFTGGEPLLRQDIVDLVAMTAGTSGIAIVALTTNGVLMPRYAQPLRRAGLQRVNFSLDTLDPQRFREITAVGDLAQVLAGLEATLAAGFETVKLNCVIEASPEEPDAQAVAAFGRQHGLEVRFIRRMDLESGAFWPVIGGEGGRCERCNRLRVTSDGLVVPCLFDNLAFSIRELGPETALRLAVEHKPPRGTRSDRYFQAIGG